MKKALLCVTALCLSVLLCSCWDYTELNLRHIATGLALDQGKELGRTSASSSTNEGG